MPEYDRIDISKGIDINKKNASKEYDICHYWYLKILVFKYEPCLCNSRHDLMQKAMDFNDAAIVSVTGSDHRIHLWYMGRDDAINVMNNSNLNEKSGSLEMFLLNIKNE